MYWDTDDQNLVNNPCPPSVMHTETGTIRAASEINIGSTVIHMPAGLRLQVVESRGGTPQPGTLPVGKDSALFSAYPAGDTDKFVWLLPEWEPEMHDRVELLHIGFSAALLDPDDWDGNIQWNFETLREPDVAPADRGVVLVTGDPTFQDIDWDSRNPDVQLVTVPPGEYEHRSWAFTKPGTYVLRVHARGKPEDGNSLGTENKSEASDISHYTFHVGSLADLSVAVSANNAAPEAGGAATYTVIAANAGPDTAPHGEVTVQLDPGLTYSTADTRVERSDGPVTDPGVTYDAEGNHLTWQVGEMGSGVSATLSFKARVGDDTRGQPLDVTANIVARESIGSSEVLQLDPRDQDNASTVTVTPVVVANQAPRLRVPRSSVTENSPAETAVGPPLAITDPDDATLFYNLTGDGAANFNANSVPDGAQIVVAPGASIDYETTQAYDLILTVTDGKGPRGNTDPAIDLTIVVGIDVENVADVPLTAELSVTPDTLAVGETATFTLTVGGEAPAELSYVLRGPGSGEGYATDSLDPPTWQVIGEGDAGAREYFAEIAYDAADGNRKVIRSNTVTVTWTASDSN